MDRITVYSCSTLTHRVRDRITTIEGIEGPNGQLHKVQAAFVAELGPRCGFLFSGQSGRCRTPRRDRIRPWRRRVSRCPAISPCGAYDRYLKGVIRRRGKRKMAYE